MELCAFWLPACCKTHSVDVESLSRVGLFCDPMDCNPPGSSVPDIFQAKVLEWVALPFSRRSWNLCLLASPALQVGSLLLSHQDSPRATIPCKKVQVKRCRPHP